MNDQPTYPSKLLMQAVEAIGTLPGVGSRSALRLALYLLAQPEENVTHFTGSIEKMRKEIKYCSHCNMISDNEVCSFCTDRTRNDATICVVESIRDVMSIEGTGRYHGLYHVLGGIISPIHGIGPGDLAIETLLRRIRRHLDRGPKGETLEIIFALSGDVEGETTAFYLYRQIEALLARAGAQETLFGAQGTSGCIKVTTLARGLGFGADLEYADALTLGRSIESRQEFKPKE
ncbi:MAG: recombination protein RecR [Bacteroidales bacterium]|nr:recombination protein RecR [Bacteroidales bacterium]